MKNRRFAIVSFVLIAVLVMGVGFAALVDTLNVTGSATFRPAAVVETDVDAAIYFTQAEADGDYCISASVKTSDPDEATMTVYFNDAGEVDRTYTATATFTVVYQPQEDNAHLPAVQMAYEASALVPGTANLAPGFTVTVEHEHVGEQKAAGMFSPGETMLVTVIVTCDANAIDNTSSESMANITVALKYSTVTVNDQAEGEENT